MKKVALLISSLFLLAAAQNSFAQCSINGPSSFDIAETSTYSFSGTASLNTNFFWSTTGVLNIVGNNTSASVNVNANQTGSGTVCVTSFKAGEEPCCECTNVTVTEIIDPPCIPATSISVSQVEIPGNGCPGDAITFNATIQPSNATTGTYTWEAGTDFIISNPFFQQTTSNSTVTINTPNDEPTVWVRVSFTSCDGSVVTALTLVVWESKCFRRGLPPFFFGNTNGNTTISPNPFKGSPNLMYNSDSELDAQIEIYNINGQLIHSRAAHFYSGQNEINLDDFPNREKGILYYKIRSADKILGFGKMHKIE